MYYCTIYMQLSGRLTNKTTFEPFICLSYSDKADAENYKQTLVDQALKSGGSIYSEEGGYTTLTGKIILKAIGMTSNRSNNHYKIGIETEASRFSILPHELKVSVPGYKTTDGLAYEVRTEELKQRKIKEAQARQDEAARNLKKFAAEIRPMTELAQVLKSFVKYYNRRTDKEKLSAVVIKKIQELI